jgi:fructose-bisphosphate aldolase/2-amino-3,7-dideoxy-D-threo-hept-6-ulosonate synthase
MTGGKETRISRITKKGRMVCVPMDHGVTNGPLPGLASVHRTIELVSSAGATAVLAHKGVIRTMPQPAGTGLIVHLNASTEYSPSPNLKVLVAGVMEAVRLGADAVSVHVNIGSDEEPHMLRDLGAVAYECSEWGVPLVAMMYPRGPRIKAIDTNTVAHVARIGAELGSDIVKTVYPGSPEGLDVVRDGCYVPLVLAGGPKNNSDIDTLKLAEEAVRHGWSGVAFGRNVFSHSRPDLITSALCGVVLGGKSADECSRILEQ